MGTSHQDLASVVALNLLGEAFHPQLSIKTLATAVVDFSGRRLIAQSLVPGILNVSSHVAEFLATKPNEPKRNGT